MAASSAGFSDGDWKGKFDKRCSGIATVPRHPRSDGDAVIVFQPEEASNNPADRRHR
jgi:hypothetical protein